MSVKDYSKNLGRNVNIMWWCGHNLANSFSRGQRPSVIKFSQKVKPLNEKSEAKALNTSEQILGETATLSTGSSFVNCARIKKRCTLMVHDLWLFGGLTR